MKEDTGQILIVDKIVNNNIVIAKDFRGQIKSEYKNVIECVKKIADYIMEKFNYRCTDGDCIYLMLHVVRLYETTLN